jgi:hypothetical protein
MRSATPHEPTAEPVALVDLGALELTAARWDSAFVVTPRIGAPIARRSRPARPSAH